MATILYDTYNTQFISKIKMHSSDFYEELFSIIL